MGLVELALEVHEVLAEELLDEQHRLLQAAETLLLVGPLGSDHDLVERLAGAHAEDDAARGQAAQRGEGLGHHGRVVAQAGGEHAGAEDDALGRGGRGTQPGQGVGGVAIGVAPGLVVIAGPDRVVAELLGGDGEVEELAWAELFGRGLVAESKHRVLSGRVGVAQARPRALNDAAQAAFLSRPRRRPPSSRCTPCRYQDSA